MGCRVPLWVGLIVLVAACTSPSPTAPTFCEVAPIIGKHCSACHASEPQFGAPMSLMSFADFDQPSRTDASVATWILVQKRLHDEIRPMPPGQKVTADELALLDSWLNGKREKGTCDKVEPQASFTGVPGIEALPCKADTFVVASDQPTDGTKMPDKGWEVPLRKDAYACFGVRLPAKPGRQMTAVAPILKDTRLVHHMILYRDTPETKLPSGFHNCKERSVDAVPLFLWGPGAGGLVLPGDVGLELGDGEVQLDLEVHYNNATYIEDAFDTSGFGLCTTDERRPISAQVATVGTLYFTIPPKQNGVDGSLSLTNTCVPPITEPTRVLATAPHMHALGRAMKTEILRSNGAVETLIDVESYNFNDQSPFPVDVTLGPDDRLRTTCRWSNPHDTPVRYGGGTDDEMCYNFLLYYPAGQLETPGFPARACIDSTEVLSHPDWPE
jgi:hypothetical protein